MDSKLAVLYPSRFLVIDFEGRKFFDLSFKESLLSRAILHPYFNLWNNAVMYIKGASGGLSLVDIRGCSKELTRIQGTLEYSFLARIYDN